MRAPLGSRPIWRRLGGSGFFYGHAIDVPVSVVWGKSGAVDPPKARLRDELPPHTRWVELLGCGHLAMWDGPELVARTILEGTDHPAPQTSSSWEQFAEG
jgi:pimeloyl-ACP methyl ester carboxylesterase